MTKKIFNSIFIVTSVAILASLLITMGILYEYFINIQDKYLADELNLASKAIEQEGESYLENFKKSDFRLTWVSSDGTVKYDTKKDFLKMENHKNREEIKEALDTGYGSSSRYSNTLLEKTLYKARKNADGSIIRISISRATAGVLVLGMLQPILIVFLLALIFSAILARRLSNRIVNPLNELDLNHPLENNNYEEISPLLRKINSQNNKINSQIELLETKKNEFAKIIANMKEALILLDNEGMILNMNNAALSLFKAGTDSVGKNFITIDRTRELSSAIDTARKYGQSEIHITKDGSIYQFNISIISSADTNPEEASGMVILAFDVTDKFTAEKSRREFTANVSHELKTPLQSIIGSAELIENDLVKPADTKVFIGKIRTEATRLVTLIDDIISLSQLDEGLEGKRTNVDLYEIANEVASSLKGLAKESAIELNVTGSKVILPNAISTLIREAIYNLTDNAIKYNVKGGTVLIDVSETDGIALISVKDTGIGIANSEQARVFERFYRVDKSHSKETGGTGLGLSIVKHAVSYHHGGIDINSEEDKGTEIILKLPTN